ELLPKFCGTSLTRLVGTSSKDKTRMSFFRFVKITVREFEPQEGSSPGTRGVASPPPAGTMQISKPPCCLVNTMVLQSADQSGSVALSAPTTRKRCTAPPFAETV